MLKLDIVWFIGVLVAILDDSDKVTVNSDELR